MKVAIVGARTFPVVAAGPDIFSWLGDTIAPGTTIFTRGSSGFDAYIAEGARFMGYTVVAMPGQGGADNYFRDMKLVDAVEHVYAFFDADHIGEGGTQHVLDKALDRGVAADSYIWDGRIIHIGSIDGGDQPADGPGDPDPDEGRPVIAAAPARQAAPESPQSRRSRTPEEWPPPDDLGF